MRIVVHIGTGKTGSTSIQESFHRHRHALLEQGILFPSEGDRRLDHRVLCEALTAAQPSPRAIAMTQDILEMVKKHAPDVLLLSSEFICYRAGRAPHLHSFLKPYSDDIRVAMYLREPLGYYRSHVQQQLKAQPWMTPPAEWKPRYMEMVSAWRDEFGAALSVIPFERARLHIGSVVDDLVHRYFPQAGRGGTLEVSRSNVSEPAEVTALVQTYIATNHPGRERVFRKDVAQLRTGLAALAKREDIGTKPALRDPVTKTILASVGHELAALKDTHGIAFNGIDYGSLPDSLPDREAGSATTFREICHVDQDVIERLTHTMFAELLSA